MNTRATHNQGFSLVEMLIYISILSLIMFVVVQISISFSQTYRQVKVLRNVDNSAMIALERMTRDIRSATNVVTAQSTLLTSPGELTLNKTGTLVSTTTRFYITNGQLKVDVNGSYAGPLTLANTSVTNLVFYRMASTTEAVRIDMTLQSAIGTVSKTKTYHTTVVLKGI